MQEMEKPTLDDRKRWWLLCYGITSMNKAIKVCGLIGEHCPDNKHPLFQSLSLAVHAYYCRPFKRSNGVGRLPADLVPEMSKGIHSFLEHFRDGVMSHLDANVSETAGVPMNDVIYSVAGGFGEFSTKEARAPLHAYVDTVKHCEAMIEVFQSGLLELMEKFQMLLPQSDGDYLLSLDDASPLFVAGYDRLLASNLNYK